MSANLDDEVVWGAIKLDSNLLKISTNSEEFSDELITLSITAKQSFGVKTQKLLIVIHFKASDTNDASNASDGEVANNSTTVNSPSTQLAEDPSAIVEQP